MPDYFYPLGAASALVERLESPASDATVRRWVLRDDNQKHHHDRIPLRDDPVVIELRWKSGTRGQEQLVGTYRLHLAALLQAGYIRREPDPSPGDDVRVRFHRGECGVVSMQVDPDEPALPIGTVDASLG